jgi:hypothetical protein
MVWPGISMVSMGTGHEKLALFVQTYRKCYPASYSMSSQVDGQTRQSLTKRKLKLIATSCVLVWSTRPFTHYLFLLSGASQCVRTNSEPSRHCAVKCTVQTDCGKPREKCLCDGDCGYSCVIPSKYISRVSLKICNRSIAHDVTAPVTMHLGDKLAIYE